jgi:translation initiation factor IF-2
MASIPRPPVVAIMGHIDHGKSTLLDYIRTTNTASGEEGGITQRISAYEVIHKTSDGNDKKITFLDTPGHEAFSKIRMRGASVADVAILVVSAEDGVKAQTLDAMKAIKSAGIPFLVAINKIDKPNANILQTKQSLAENEIYVEGYGGDITSVPISAKTGDGVSELLDMILLTTDVLGHTGLETNSAEGIVIEAHTDKKSGTTATLIVKDGTLKVGDFIVCGKAWAPVRYIEDFRGIKIPSATFSSPVRLTGWSELPDVGDVFSIAKNKNEAMEKADLHKQSGTHAANTQTAIAATASESYIPVVIKADAQGAIDAILHEIIKINSDRISYKVVHTGVGDIRETDAKIAMAKEGTIIVGFSVTIDKQADALRERHNLEIKSFGIIYELADYLKELLVSRTPKKMIEEHCGTLKVLKFFSKMKDKQVIGGRVEAGIIEKDALVKIMRRENEIGRGHIRELQCQKIKTSTVNEGNECGLMIEAKIEVAPGDKLESCRMIEK